jgi:16S rRNA (adenine1518-N6/adenine1519-N6)-dimethyltransferase
MRKQTLRSELASAPTGLRPGAALALAGVRPRKSRGQNFLVQPRIAEAIVDRAQLTAGDEVVEIGPGLGILTGFITRAPIARVILVELDAALAHQLKEHFNSDRRVELVNADFLHENLFGLIGTKGVKVIGNLPFNSAAAILERLCSFSRSLGRTVLMFQREVAERIRARPGDRDYGALSVFTALYWEIVDHFRVAAGSFYPRPKGDAEVLVLVPREVSLFSDAEEQGILRTVRAAFASPRKTIRNSLATGWPLTQADSEQMLEQAAIAPSARPAELAVADFVRLAHILSLMAVRRSTNTFGIDA